MPDPPAGSSIPPAYAGLLSLAAHELRTPASVVGGYLRMLHLDHEPPLSERQRRMVDEDEKSCARLVALIGELSELSGTPGQRPLRRSPSTSFTSSGKRQAACARPAISRFIWRPAAKPPARRCGAI